MLDKYLGVLFTICFVVGLAGNVSELLYFWSNERKSLPDKLYIAIVSVDIITILRAIGLTSYLINDRDTHLCLESVLSGFIFHNHSPKVFNKNVDVPGCSSEYH